MRIWDQVPPTDLCDQHLLAQWREGLGLWSILTDPAKTGYRNHPETKRWVGHERPLGNFLHRTRNAMLARGWSPKAVPNTPLFVSLQPNDPSGRRLPTPWDDQLAALRAKGCACKVPQEITA